MCCAVTTIRSQHRVEGIGERKQPSAERSVVTDEAVGISFAVPTFMMMPDDGRTVLQHGRAPYDLLPDSSVLLQKQGLGRRSSFQALRRSDREQLPFRYREVRQP